MWQYCKTLCAIAHIFYPKCMLYCADRNAHSVLQKRSNVRNRISPSTFKIKYIFSLSITWIPYMYVHRQKILTQSYR